MLLKAGMSATALNHLGMSALDACLIEMRGEVGDEISEWLKIAKKLAQKATQRSKFTVALLKLQTDPNVKSQDRIQKSIIFVMPQHELFQKYINFQMLYNFVINKSETDFFVVTKLETGFESLVSL